MGPATIYDYEPHLAGVATAEPSLRQILRAYYVMHLNDQDKAARLADEYVRKVEAFAETRPRVVMFETE